MKTLKMSCKLLTDIVLNTSSATEGDHTTLDFIPGNNFLGIVAKHYDAFTPREQMEIFHSGRVRFGDAHPVAFNEDGTVIPMRTLHVPAALFYPKMHDASEKCYVMHLYDREKDKKSGQPMQLKQCRKGYYAFQEGKGYPAKTEKGFTLKSAYDRSNRTSCEGQMFGYESLKAGLTFFFEVEVDDDVLAPRIEELLTGEQYVGRSRSAEYGQVRIEACSFAATPFSATPIRTRKGDRVAVYADSRLIFPNNEGQPVFQPTAKQLGLEGEIDWELSQVRTFQYAPWNFKRNAHDVDRCGIEKGSVFFVKASGSTPNGSAYVGSYRNEGFGRVIYNPDFLRGTEKEEDNGKALWTLSPLQASTEQERANPTALQGTPLLDFVRQRLERDEAEKLIMRKVNDFVEENRMRFQGAAFASQWGTIRSIAMAHPDKDSILNELFDKKGKKKHEASPSDPTTEYRTIHAAYLTHGIAAEKWKKQKRGEKLRKFIDDPEVADAYKQAAVINLASEMAKICKSNGKD